MVELAAGEYRFAVYDSSGVRVGESGPANFQIWNNTTAPQVVMGGGGTINDRPVTAPPMVSGPDGQVLVLEFLHTTAATFDTSACTIAFEGTKYYSTRVGGKRLLRSTALSLRFADRLLLTDDPLGIADDPVTVASKWSPVVAFKPRSNENWHIHGIQHFISDAA